MPLPMAGVGGVKVAPEARGQGVAKTLMTELLAVMARRGYLVSVLYPATAHLYRSLGWEFAGGSYRAKVPARSLGSLLPPDPQAAEEPGDVTGVKPRGDPGGRPPGPALRRAGPDDAREVIAVLGAVHSAARSSGPCTRDPATLRRWLAEPDFFGYLADDGFLAYGWRGSGSREITVHCLQAASARTARALWGLLGSHASVTEVVHVNVGPADAIGWLTREPEVSVRLDESWMLRVVDARAAIAGRGFPAAVELSAPLVLADPDLPASSGRYTLTVAGGKGLLAEGLTERATASPAPEPVKFGARGFAALFAGVPAATLRLAGLVSGGDARADALLDAAFAAQAYCLDHF
jgi:predicted acetyltransferase